MHFPQPGFVRPSLPLAAAWLLLIPDCGGFRLPHAEDGEKPLSANPEAWIVQPSGNPVVPKGRHIQYLYHNNDHGITDRLKLHFRRLVRLGNYFNATVHIEGGEDGSTDWLDRRHSIELAPSWARYVNTTANGANPFHPLENFRGCRVVKEHGFPAATLFDGGERCVNIETAVANLDYRGMERADDNLQPSDSVLDAAGQFLREQGIPDGQYGTVHIRRCDRPSGPLLLRNVQCTEPSMISGILQEYSNISVWLIFMYSEAAYPARLQAALEPLMQKRPDMRILYEHEVTLNQRFPEDNYFTYLVGKHLCGKAAVNVETHICLFSGRPQIYLGGAENGLYLGRLPTVADGLDTASRSSDPASLSRQVSDAQLDEEAELQEESSAYCDDRERAAGFIPAPGAERPKPAFRGPGAGARPKPPAGGPGARAELRAG